LIREGYDAPIIEAICEYEGVDNYLDSYISRMQGEKRKKGIIRDYNVPSGRIDALTDLCLEHKTDYALPVSRKIIAQLDKTKRIPSTIETLFSSLAEQIGHKKFVAEVEAK
jgi:hypothetical protein